MELDDAADCAGMQTWPTSTNGSPASLSSELSVNTCHRRLCVCCGIYCSWAYDGPSTCDEWRKGSSVTLCQLLSAAGSTTSWSTGMYRRTEASSTSGSLTSLLSTSDSMSTDGALLPCRRAPARRWRQHRCTFTQNTFKLEHSAKNLHSSAHSCWRNDELSISLFNRNYLSKIRYKELVHSKCVWQHFDKYTCHSIHWSELASPVHCARITCGPMIRTMITTMMIINGDNNNCSVISIRWQS